MVYEPMRVVQERVQNDSTLTDMTGQVTELDGTFYFIHVTLSLFSRVWRQRLIHMHIGQTMLQHQMLLSFHGVRNGPSTFGIDDKLDFDQHPTAAFKRLLAAWVGQCGIQRDAPGEELEKYSLGHGTP